MKKKIARGRKICDRESNLKRFATTGRSSTRNKRRASKKARWKKTRRHAAASRMRFKRKREDGIAVVTNGRATLAGAASARVDEMVRGEQSIRCDAFLRSLSARAQCVLYIRAAVLLLLDQRKQHPLPRSSPHVSLSAPASSMFSRVSLASIERHRKYV